MVDMLDSGRLQHLFPFSPLLTWPPLFDTPVPGTIYQALLHVPAPF